MTQHNHDLTKHYHGLVDDCPRCKVLADDPIQLDAANLERIWTRSPKTKLDVQAYNRLFDSVALVDSLLRATTDEATPLMPLRWERTP